VLIGLGGGSPIDAAKAVSFFAQQDTGGAFIPQIAIPTTLSAAEFTMGAGYTSEEGRKTGVKDPQLAPKAIILDAELTLFTPERLWLSSGMRAVDHAIEIQYAFDVPAPIKRVALFAINALFTYLPKSKADPQDVAARQKLQLAAWESLWPIQSSSSPGLSHSLGRTLGAAYSIPHGITSCLTLARTVALMATILPRYEKSCLAAAAAFIPKHFRLDDKSDAADASSLDGLEDDVLTDKCLVVARAFGQLVRELDLASTLGEYNVPEADYEKIAISAVGDVPNKATPSSTVVVLEVLKKIS